MFAASGIVLAFILPDLIASHGATATFLAIGIVLWLVGGVVFFLLRGVAFAVEPNHAGRRRSPISIRSF